MGLKAKSTVDEMHIDERNNIVPAMFQYASGKLTRPISKFEGDILAFVQSLHNVSEATKEQYTCRLRKFVRFLRCKHIHSFERVAKRHIDEFLASYNKPSSKALAMLVLKRFFVEHLKKPELVEHLKIPPNKLATITPSELLTLDEVVKLAEECGRRREEYKVLVLVLFESAARISEVLSLKVGDVEFASVLDKKDGTHKLIAKLWFKRVKGGGKKEPVVLAMFAMELKRYWENHKNDGSAWLFPSPYNKSVPVSCSTAERLLANAAERIGLKKRCNPHWLRHSALSYFANNLNYNEQLLMWRAGWRNTIMAKRYVHSGAELENASYLEKMGFEPPETTLKQPPKKPKPCPHCNMLNPATNNNCDYCGMPLDIKEYEELIQKKRDMEMLYKVVKDLVSLGLWQIDKDHNGVKLYIKSPEGKIEPITIIPSHKSTLLEPSKS